MKRPVWLVCIGLLIFGPTPAWAVEFRGGNDVVIAEGEVVEDDLYVGATTVTVDGTVRGDVIASGRTITVNGTVEGDLMAAGQSVTVNGEVGDDIRIAGAALRLGPNARIDDDVVAAGYSLEAEAGSVIGGTLNFGGGQALLAGDITEDVNVGAGGLELLGTVGGNVEAELGAGPGSPQPGPAGFIPGMPEVPSVALGFSLGEGARVDGETNVVEQDAAPAATRTRSRLWTSFQRFLALSVVGLLLLWLAPNLIERSATQLEARPWTSLGLGALTLVGVPVAISILVGVFILLAVLLAIISLGSLGGAVGVIGGAIALILGVLFALTLIYMTYVVVAYYGGRWLLNRGSPGAEVSPVWAMLLGTFVLVVLTSIPVLGPIAAVLTLLFGLGALWWIRRRGPRPSQEPTQQATT